MKQAMRIWVTMAVLLALEAGRAHAWALAGSRPAGALFSQQGGSIAGHVFLADGATPVVGACVNVGLTAPEWQHLTGTCCTAADGSYTISGLVPGTYFLRTHASCQGANAHLIDEWYATGGDSYTPVTVEAGKTTGGIAFSLQSGGSITGHVLLSDGVTPVAGACVNVGLTAPEWQKPVATFCCTAADGGYTISGLTPGTYFLRTQANCHGANPQLIDRWYATGADEYTSVAVEAGKTTATVDIPLRAAEILDLDYYLTISDPSTGLAHVRIAVSQVLGDSILFETSDSRGLFIALRNLTARAADGTALPLTPVPDDEQWQGKVVGRAWRIDCGTHSSIVIEYDADPTPSEDTHGLHGYIATDWALLEGQTVFLIPESHKGSSVHTIRSVSVHLTVPTVWRIYTPWTPASDHYDPALSGGYALDSLSSSTIALGNMALNEGDVGNTHVMVATYAPWGMGQAAFDGVAALFAFQTGLFGASVGERYLCGFVPHTPAGQSVYTGEWSTGQGYSLELTKEGRINWQWDMFSHQIFHRWNAWQPWSMSGYQGWFTEGVDVFYESRAIAVGRLWVSSYARYMERLRTRDETYRRDYYGTPLDIPFFDGPSDAFLVYEKAMLVTYRLATEMYERTDGAATLDDLMAYLFERYGGQFGRCTEVEIIAALNGLTGTDFGPFFASYVHSNQFVDVSDAFNDSDGDGLLNGEETLWLTDRTAPDTDGDGYSDSREVALGSDPRDALSQPRFIYLPLVYKP